MNYDELVRDVRQYANQYTGTYNHDALLNNAADAITKLQARVAELETELRRALAIAPSNAIAWQERAIGAELERDQYRHERDAIARQLAISRSLLMECVQNLSPPWQNPDHPLWSLKSRIKATFGGQSS